MLSTTNSELPSRVPAPRHYSLECEPWRDLRSSLAVEFRLRKNSCRNHADLEVEIMAGLEARVAIKSRYCQLHSALWNLLERGVSGRRGLIASGNLKDTARHLIESGALREQSDIVLEAVDRLDRQELLVNGFVEVVEERSGAVRFCFELLRMRRCFTAQSLVAEMNRFDSSAEKTLDRIHAVQLALSGNAQWTSSPWLP